MTAKIMYVVDYLKWIIRLQYIINTLLLGSMYKTILIIQFHQELQCLVTPK